MADSGPRPDKPEQSLLHRIGEASSRVGRSDRQHRRSVQIAIRVGVAVLVLGFLVYALLSQLDKLPDYDWHFDPGWLALAAVGFFIQYVIQGYFWTLILRFLGERLDPAVAQSIWAKSILARYVPGNMLMVVGRVVMAERQGISRKASLSSVIYEIGLTMCAAVLVASYFIFTLPQLSDSIFRWALIALVPVALVGLHPRIFRPVADYLLHKLGREPLPAALPFRYVILMVILYGASWLVLGLASFCFVRALYPVQIGDIPVITASFALAWGIAVITFIAPSGLGTRDVAYAAALSSILPGTVAIAVAISARIFQTVVELIYVAIAVFIGRNRSP